MNTGIAFMNGEIGIVNTPIAIVNTAGDATSAGLLVAPMPAPAARVGAALSRRDPARPQDAWHVRAPIHLAPDLKDRATWARAPIILATGASREDIPPDLQFDELLPKPFSIERLLELVHGHAHQTAEPATLSPGE